jgi:hypothetical protein
MALTSHIYALVHPISGEIRYVGKCVTSLKRRLHNHEYRARSGRDKTPKGEWIRQLHLRGLHPLTRPLEVTTELRWQDAERRWIAKLRAEGHPLLNLHAGGNGAHTRAALAPQYASLLGTISDARIAEMAGLCRETVTYHRRRAGIHASNDRSRVKCTFQKGAPPPNKIEIPSALLGQLGKLSDGELAKTCGVSRGLIKQRRKKAGIAPALPKGKTPHGTDHPNAKLTEEVVRQIRARYKRYSRTDGCGVMAKELGIDRSTVHDVVTGKIWRVRYGG